jgi:hypothetical protein
LPLTYNFASAYGLAANSEEKVKGRQFCAGIFKKMGKKKFLYL